VLLEPIGACVLSLSVPSSVANACQSPVPNNVALLMCGYIQMADMVPDVRCCQRVVGSCAQSAEDNPPRKTADKQVRTDGICDCNVVAVVTYLFC
jgi:hypothetical protein